MILMQKDYVVYLCRFQRRIKSFKNHRQGP